MRQLASVALAVILLSVVPVASAYDGRVESSQLSSTPKVGISLESDRGEANPGDEVRYWIRVTNLYNRQLGSWKVAFFFPRADVSIIDAGGATGAGDHLVWTVSSMVPGAAETYTVRVRLSGRLRAGASIRTYGSMIWDGQISPACSKNDLLIISRPPVTGADSTSPVEDLQAFLRPVSSATSGSSMPFLFWVSVSLLGLAVGAGVVKQVIVEVASPSLR